MPQFLSAEWVDAFNGALEGAELSSTGEPASIAAESGQFTITQVVRGTPGPEISTTLTVDAGRVTLALGPPPSPPNVTVVLSYEDAASLSLGRLEPAMALEQGRVAVRGDLSVLVAGSTLLAAAADRLADLHAATTYG